MLVITAKLFDSESELESLYFIECGTQMSNLSAHVIDQ